MRIQKYGQSGLFQVRQGPHKRTQTHTYTHAYFSPTPSSQEKAGTYGCWFPVHAANASPKLARGHTHTNTHTHTHTDTDTLTQTDT